MTFSKQDAKDMWRNGESPTDILRAATHTGIEYPDAVWLVSSTLRMDEDEREDMEHKYTDFA